MQNAVETTVLDDDSLLQSDTEKIRRQKFESILKLQEENRGVIEPKKHEVLQPGMFLPRRDATPSTSTDKNPQSEENNDQEVNSRGNHSFSSKRVNFGSRRHTRRGHYSGNRVREWIRKEDSTSS